MKTGPEILEAIKLNPFTVVEFPYLKTGLYKKFLKTKQW